jgi:hypothetical protein
MSDGSRCRNLGPGQVAAAFVGALAGLGVEAACLDIDDVSSACRYPAGDAWCARNDGVNPYAYRDGCVDEAPPTEVETPARAPVRSAPGDPVVVWDCAKARTRVERLICANPDIRARDARMGALYSELQALGLSPERMQKAWLRNERAACDDADCLRTVYAERIRFFESLLRPETVTGEPLDADPDPVSVIGNPPMPDPVAEASATSPRDEVPASPVAAAATSEPTPSTDGVSVFVPELPQPELPSSRGYGASDPGTPVSPGVGSPEPDQRPLATRTSDILLAVGAIALILAIGLVARVRGFNRSAIRGAIAFSRDRLGPRVRSLSAASAGWFAQMRRLRLARRASERDPRDASRPIEFRLSNEMLARLHALAEPGESMSHVVGRAIAALESRSEPPPAAAVVSRMAALEARLAHLEGERSVPSPSKR